MANATSTKEAPARGRGLSWNGMLEYLRGVKEELRPDRTKWPTRPELIRLTQVVLAVIVIVAIYVGTLDALLAWITGRLLDR